MKFLKTILIAFLLITTPVSSSSQEEPKELRTITFGDKTYVIRHPPTDRLSKKVLFVFDKSGSMRGDKFAEALGLVSIMTQQAFDSWEFAMLAFNAEIFRWPGIPEPNATPPIPPNWAGLPSENARQAVMAYIHQLGARGDTFVIPALTAALHENRDELSIVLVSDGIFQTESDENILKAIKDGQKWREQNKLSKAGIMVISVTSNPPNIMQKIAKLSSLGHLHYK